MECYKYRVLKGTLVKKEGLFLGFCMRIAHGCYSIICPKTLLKLLRPLYSASRFLCHLGLRQ